MRAHRHEIRRVRLARDHLQDRAGPIVGAEKPLRVELARSIDDRGDLGVKHRTAGQQNAVLATADDLAVLDDHRAERAAPALLDRLGRKPRGLFHVFALIGGRCRRGRRALGGHRVQAGRRGNAGGSRHGGVGEERPPVGIGHGFAGETVGQSVHGASLGKVEAPALKSNALRSAYAFLCETIQMNRSGLSDGQRPATQCVADDTARFTSRKSPRR